MSAAELLLAAQLEQADIDYARECQFHPSRKWRADFSIEPMMPARLLVEIDGGGFVGGRHGRGRGIEADAEKQTAAAILGYRVLRVTPGQVEDGRALEWIRDALGLDAA